ncbi:MAG TPA: amino acid adenylation domain-containing protein, partial [Ktedonobacteraceae bacterium]|nr:amino acid adenylation domain-containing protein [Ktedonobacteraceae bacterium]
VLPLRSRIGSDSTVAAYLGTVKQTLFDAYDYQVCSFLRLVKILNVPRDPARFPLISVMFNLESGGSGGTQAFAGLDAALMDNPTCPARFDLFINVTETSNDLLIECDYNADLFDSQTIEGWIQRWRFLLQEMTTDEQQQLWQALRLAPEEEARLASWNPTPTPLADPRSLPARLRAQAERTPDAIALCFQGEALSYQALFQQAEKLAQRLSAQGARPERLVGLCVERGPRYVQVLLAIVLTGAAFLPLDPHLPEQRLRFLLADAHLDLLVGERPLLAHPGARKGEPIPVLEMEEIWEDSRRSSSAGLSLPEPLPDQLAYVIYTSGSTGVPKGVQITQRGLARLIEAQCPLFSIRQGSRVLQFATPSFDAAISEIFTTLASGACLVLAPREQLLPGPDLQQVLREQAIGVVTLPPTALATIEGETLPALATVVSAGETCPRALVEAWRGGGRFLNAYGPTEVTVCATAGVLPTGQPLAAVPSIGGPLPHSPVYVLDEQMQRVPIGVVGELYVGGDALARGYRGQAGWTAERFVPDPFSGQAGARLYRTGDRGRWREEGELEYAGRWDRQVKLRGYRIELEEIEAVLREHPEVEDCALVVRQEENGERWLVGYVVGRGSEKGSQEGPAAWRKWLKERLPAYQVPARLVELEALPLLPSGKHNLQALPAPENARERERGSLSTVPQSTLEQAIVEIWSEALHVERIGLYDNFFDLGGHSIAALRVYGKLLPLFNGELTMTDLFTYPTISALVEHFTRVEEPQREERVNEEQIRSSQNRRQSRLKVKETLLAKRENR